MHLRHVSTAAVVSGALLAIGCSQEDVRHFRVAKATPTAQRAPAVMPGMAGGAVAPPPAIRSGAKLAWTLPTGWSEEPGSGMRYATLRAPVPCTADISVTVLAGEGGGELPNVNRWRGQVGLPPVDEATLESARRAVKTSVGTVAVYDFTSAKQRMIAGLTFVDGNSWFFKITGEVDMVGLASHDFLELVGSLRREEAK